MLTFKFSGADGVMTVAETLTSGMVGKNVKLEFTDDWENLKKTVVFSNNSVTRDVMYTSEVIEIPPDVLRYPGRLFIGIYGVSKDGNDVTPTIMAPGPKVMRGADPSGDESTDPELPVWKQIQDQIGSLHELDTEAKDNLVAAINEAAASVGDVQPDYNQNDETAADHIKNRPFYTGAVGENVYCDVEVLVSDGWGTIFPKPNLEPNTTYNVLFDGGWYEARYNGETLGNEALRGGNLGYELAEGELPFCVDNDGELGTNVDGVHTLEIYRLEPIVKTVDPVYLPLDYKPAVNIQQLANISSRVQTYKASREAWTKTFALAKAVFDGECVPYCTLPMALACGIETLDADNADNFGAYYVIYENGFNEDNQTVRIQTKRYLMRSRYDSDTQTVTVTPEIWKHAEPVWEIPVATADKLGGVKPVNKTAAMTEPVGVDANGLLYTTPGDESNVAIITTADYGIDLMPLLSFTEVKEMSFDGTQLFADVTAAYNAGKIIFLRQNMGVDDLLGVIPTYTVMDGYVCWFGGKLTAEMFGFMDIYVGCGINQNTNVATIRVLGKAISAEANPVTDDHINSLIDEKLGVIENGTY